MSIVYIFLFLFIPLYFSFFPFNILSFSLHTVFTEWYGYCIFLVILE